MNQGFVSFAVFFPLLLLSSCAVNSVAVDSGEDNHTCPCSISSHTEPYWSNHFHDTGYGYHNMGYWGVGSWDIGSYRNIRAF